MNYCKECGSPLKPDTKFCAECGSTVSDSSTSTSEQPKPVNSSPQKPAPPKKSWTKKQKFTALGIAIAVILLIIGQQVGAMLTDKDRIIEKFGEAILDQDSKTVANMLHSDDSRLEITEEGVENLLAIINDNPSTYTYLMDSLKAQSEAFDQKDSEENAEYYSDIIFSLAKNGKTALIYDNYQINVMPFYFTIETNFPEAKIFVGDEEIATADSEEFSKEYGPVLPGTYQLKAEYTDEYAMLENSFDIELLEPYDQDQYVDLSLYGEYISLSADYSDAATNVTYYINGKEVELEDENTFGPISLDNSIKAYAELEFPWGKVKTEEVTIDDTYMSLTVDSPFTDSVKTEIMEAVHTNARDWAKAYPDLDDSKFTNVTNNYLENSVKNEFESMETWDRKWTGTYKKALFDLDSFSLSSDDDGNYLADVDVSLYYDSATYYAEDEEEVETEENENNWQYQLIYDKESGKWLINEYYSLFSVNHDNSKELLANSED